MKFLKKVFEIIPKQKKKKLPFFIGISLLNTILDFISIALLIPYILLIFDREKSINFLQSYISYPITKSTILWSLVFLISLYILKNIIQSIIIYSKSNFIHEISTDISTKLINNYFNGSYLEHIQQEQGVLLRDFQRVPKIFSTNVLIPLSQIFSESLIALTILGISFFINPTVTILATLFVLIALFILLKIKSKKTTFLNNNISISIKETLNHLINIFSGFLQIKSSKSEEEFANEFNNANQKHNKLLALLTSYKQSNIKFLELFIIIGISGLVFYSFQFDGDFMSLAILSFFISAIIKLIPSFNKISTSIIDIKSNLYTVDILSKYQQQQITKKNDIHTFNKIELKNICFNYSKNTSLIESINVEIRNGDFISITGESGIGKTTLLKIISGIIYPQKGEVLIDNKKVKHSSFFNFASIVSQEPFIFQGTLLDNITMKRSSNIDISFILDLIDKFELKKWFDTLEKGLDTMLFLDSKSISGGQKQRIALIRALYSRPKLLLLDESTNQIEKTLEVKILNYLKLLTEKEKLTIVAISHHQNLLEFVNKKIAL